MTVKYANKVISRVIEIRGDQTLDELHQAIFRAFDRCDQRPYAFHLGKRAFDSQGPSKFLRYRRTADKRPIALPACGRAWLPMRLPVGVRKFFLDYFAN